MESSFPRDYFEGRIASYVGNTGWTVAPSEYTPAIFKGLVIRGGVYWNCVITFRRYGVIFVQRPCKELYWRRSKFFAIHDFSCANTDSLQFELFRHYTQKEQDRRSKPTVSVGDNRVTLTIPAHYLMIIANIRFILQFQASIFVENISVCGQIHRFDNWSPCS